MLIDAMTPTAGRTMRQPQNQQNSVRSSTMAEHTFSYTFTIPEMRKSLLGTIPAYEIEHNYAIDLDPGEERLIPEIQAAFEAVSRQVLSAGLNEVKNWVDRKNNDLITYQNNLDRFLGEPDPWRADADAITRGVNDLWTGLDNYTAYMETWTNQVTARTGNEVANKMEIAYNNALKNSFSRHMLRNLNKSTLHAMPEHQQFRRKRARVWAGKGGKTFMLASITAAQAAATGVGHPAFGIVTVVKAVGAAWRNLPRIYTLVQAIWEDTKIQVRTLKRAEKDIKAVLVAFDEAKTRNSSLAKHVTEMESQARMRAQKLQGLRREVAEATKIRDMPAGQVSRKLMEQVTKRIGKIQNTLDTLEGYDTRMQQLTAQLTAFNIVLPPSAYNAQANTILGNLKKFFLSAQGQGEIGTLFHDLEAVGFDIQTTLRDEAREHHS
jgi:hypothetical protein